MPPRPVRYSPLQLWHLLSLDAPTVAALWTVFCARCAHVAIPWTGAAAMFLAVWMLYVADRILDARPSGRPPVDLEARHHFHHRHRVAFLTLFCVASIVLAMLLHTLLSGALHRYIVLASLLAGYLLLIHATAGPHTYRWPKELAVGLFFPAAVLIPTAAHMPSLEFKLLLPGILFAAVCTLNCLFLYAWEHPIDRSAAHISTRWATRHLRKLSIAAIALSVALLPLIAKMQSGLAWIAVACALSTLLLLGLHTVWRRFQPVTLRALADVALLTPVLLLPFIR